MRRLTDTTDFFELVQAQTDLFVESHPTDQIRYNFDGLGSIRCIHGSRQIRDLLGRASQHLSTRAPKGPDDSTFYYLDEKTSGFELPKSTWTAQDIGPQGIIQNLDSEAHRAVWQFGSNVLYLFDRIQGWGLFWTRDATKLPHWELSFPLRYPITWSFEKKEALMVHASAVGNQNGAVMIVGKSGSGKSTTSLSGLSSGMDFYGDDYILVQLSEAAATVHSLFNAVKVDQKKLPQLGLNNLDSYLLGGDNNETKRVTYLNPAKSKQLKNNSPLKALIFPCITQEPSPSMHPISAVEMLRESAPSTLFQIPCDRISVFQKMSRLVHLLPSFRFHLTPDLKKNATFLDQFVSDL